MGLFKKIGKTVSKGFKKATKVGLINPLGLGQGDLWKKRLRKFAKVGAGAATGFAAGGIPGAIAGGGLVGLGQIQKGAGNEALTPGSLINPALKGGIAGTGAGMVMGTGLGGGLLGAGKAGTSNWGKYLVASKLTSGLLGGGGQPSMPAYDPAQVEMERQQRIQNILDSYNKRKERYFYA